jgi:hypothetical protein
VKTESAWTLELEYSEHGPMPKPHTSLKLHPERPTKASEAKKTPLGSSCVLVAVGAGLAAVVEIVS